ncbi:hypothetical protein EV360DRAFT_74586 [Lentinula raphanica]|nr:hypothetical protein EV360DRAFT_74586 [Lentinula raphanica]
MQLFSRTKKGLRRLAFVALLFSAISLAVPINPEVDFESNKSTHSLSTSQEPVNHDIVSRSALRPRARPTEGVHQPLFPYRFEVVVKSNHFDTNRYTDVKVKENLRKMLNSEVFFLNLRSAAKDAEIKRILGEFDTFPGIEISDFTKDPNPEPLFEHAYDTEWFNLHKPKPEDYQLRILISARSESGGEVTPIDNVVGFIETASLWKRMRLDNSEAMTIEGDLATGRLWIYEREGQDKDRGTIYRNVLVKLENGKLILDVQIGGKSPNLKTATKFRDIAVQGVMGVMGGGKPRRRPMPPRLQRPGPPPPLANTSPAPAPTPSANASPALDRPAH